MFFNYVFSFLSVWYVVCITVENYVTICQPYHFRSFCSTRRALFMVSVVLGASFTLYSFSAFTSKVTLSQRGQMECGQHPGMDRVMEVMTYVDSVITLLVPFIVISAMLIPIALSICRTKKWRQRLSSVAMLDPMQLAQLMEAAKKPTVRKSPKVQIAKMLLALSVSYIVMNAPSHFSKLFYLIRSQQDVYLSHSEGLVLLVLQLFSYLHHSIKFWIFMAISKNFSKQVRKTLSKVHVKLSWCCKESQDKYYVSNTTHTYSNTLTQRQQTQV